MWNGSGWLDGRVGLSPGGTAEPQWGQIRQYPWLGGTDLLADAAYPLYAGSGFGSAEVPADTYYGATQFFESTALATRKNRLVGMVDLRILTGTSGVDKLVCYPSTSATYSGGTKTVATMSSAEFDTATVASPVGGTAQSAAFWLNATYPTKSLITGYGGKQLLIAYIRDANTITPLKNWLISSGSANAILPMSDTYSECQTLLADNSGLHVIAKLSGAPGGSNPTLATMQADGMWGVMLPVANITASVVAECGTRGLKLCAIDATTNAQVVSMENLGVDIIVSSAPQAAFTTPVTPPPTVGKTVWGYAATSAGDISSAMSASPSLERPKIARVYCNGDINGNGSVNWNENLFGLDQPALWSSCKPSLSRMGNPASLALDTVNYFKANVPKGQYIFHTFWHEPEGTSDVGGGSISAKQARWHDIHTALWDEFVAARALGWKFFTAPIICDWVCKQSTGSSKGTLDTWYPTSWQSYDVQGYDVYPQGRNASGANDICRVAMSADNVVLPYADASRYDCYDFINRIAAHAKKCGKPWGSGETGIIRQDLSGADVLYNCTLQQKGQRHQDIVNHVSALSNPPWIWTWYDDGGCTIHGNDPGGYSAAVWNATIRNSGTLTA